MIAKSKPSGKYSVRVVAQKTGVNPDTLRTWERRYQAVEPHRSAGGTRYYDDESVARIHLLCQATAQGHAISAIAGLSSIELQRMVRGGVSRIAHPVPSDNGLAAMMRAVETHNLAEFERLVGTAALAYHVREFLEQVVQPVLVEVGNRWEQGQMTIAEEHAVSASLRAVLLALVRTYQRPLGTPKVLLATLPDERHEFGILMFQLIAASVGVSVHYLGPDVPVMDLVHTATTLKVEVIALSAINCGLAESARHDMLQLLETLPSSVSVWVGGRCAENVVGAIRDSRLLFIRDLFELEQRLQLMRGR